MNNNYNDKKSHSITSYITCFLLFWLLLFPVILEFNDTKKAKNDYNRIKKELTGGYEDIKKELNGAYEDIKINPPSEYDYLTKKEIYEIRKNFVAQSIFASENYEPSEEVFGQIVDNKPWWGDIICGQMNYNGDYHEHIEGNSHVSIIMNNPASLVSLNHLYFLYNEPYYRKFCNSQYAKYIPVSIKYNKEKKHIIETYEIGSEFPRLVMWDENEKLRPIPIKLSGLNARDFGYNYVWASNLKNIKMFYPTQPNFENNVCMFHDYVHLGGSCRYAGGCNNISPKQPELTFWITELPAEMTLKLRKNMPEDKSAPEDFTFTIKLEKEN